MQSQLTCAHCPVRGLVICGGVEPADSEAMQPSARVYRAGELIYRERERSEDFLTILDGWALKFTMTRDGRRQVLSFLLPGDHVALDLLGYNRLTFSVQAITECTVCSVDRKAINRLIEANDGVLRRLQGRYRFRRIADQEHIVSLGRRLAAGRIAYLFLEMSLRLAGRGFRDETALPFFIRQRDIADALGLTPVHVSRMLREFRKEGIAELNHMQLSILNKRRLMEISGISEDQMDISLYGVNIQNFVTG